jgi:ABC-type branched-subunit amino acid transport system ATPase component
VTTFVDGSAVSPNGDGIAPLIVAKDVSVRFGGLRALSNVSVSVPPATIIGLVGPNGAGKSTLFGVLSGLLRPNTGSVYLMGEDVTKATPMARAREGMARTFQQPELFMGLTVREHLTLADRVRHDRRRLWRDTFTFGCLKKTDPAEQERVQGLMDLLLLEPFANQLADGLPLGTARLVEVGRALAARPSVILLDEPLAGLDAHEAERLGAALRRTVNEEKVSLFLVEHDVGMVLNLSNHIYVLDFGSLIAEGTPEEVRTDPGVRAAYLGDEGTPVEVRTLHHEEHDG